MEGSFKVQLSDSFDLKYSFIGPVKTNESPQDATSDKSEPNSTQGEAMTSDRPDHISNSNSTQMETNPLDPDTKNVKEDNHESQDKKPEISKKLQEIIQSLLSNDHVKIIFRIHKHLHLKYLVIHDFPLDASGEYYRVEKDFSQLPPITFLGDEVLFYHISYYQHCLKRQDPFVLYVNDEMEKLKESVLLRAQLNPLVLYKQLYSLASAGKSLFGSSCGKWTLSAIKHACKQLSLEGDVKLKLKSMLEAIKPEFTRDSIKEVVQTQGLHKLSQYGIDVVWAWKDMDLVVCLPNEFLFREYPILSKPSKKYPWSQSALRGLPAVKQSRCTVMDHSSSIRAITHNFPIPASVTADAITPLHSNEKGFLKNFIQERFLQSYILENVDGFVCTLFYEQGEWLVVSPDSFKTRYSDRSELPFDDFTSLTNDMCIQQSINNNGMRNNSLGAKDFSDLFWSIYYDMGYKMPTDMNCCYTFVLQSSQYTKHAVENTDRLLLLSAHRIENDSPLATIQVIRELDLFQAARELKVEVPKLHSFRSIYDLNETLRSLNPQELRGYTLLIPLDDIDIGEESFESDLIDNVEAIKNGNKSSDNSLRSLRLISNDSLMHTRYYERILLDSPQFISMILLKNTSSFKTKEEKDLLYQVIGSGFEKEILSQLNPLALEHNATLFTISSIRSRIENYGSLLQKVYDSRKSLNSQAFKKQAETYPFARVLNEMRKYSKHDFLKDYVPQFTDGATLSEIINQIEKYEEISSKEHFDYLVVIDFEATCDDGPNPEITAENQEIIEFPIVVIDLSISPEAINTEKNQSEENKFPYNNIVYMEQNYVRPVLSKRLTKFCTALTGITWDKLENADTLDVVIDKVDKTLKRVIPEDKKFCIICDGDWDIKTMIFREAERKNIKLPSYYYKYFNIKKEVRREFPKKMTNSLRVMASNMNVPIYGHHHCGIDDCITITGVINALIQQTNHQFENPIILGEDYRSEQPKPFKADEYGPWKCFKCHSTQQERAITCSVCRTKRPSRAQSTIHETMRKSIIRHFRLPRHVFDDIEEENHRSQGSSVSSTHSSNNQKQNSKTQQGKGAADTRVAERRRAILNQFIKLLKNGALGIFFFFVMKRLEPKRIRLWGFVSLVMILVGFFTGQSSQPGQSDPSGQDSGSKGKKK